MVDSFEASMLLGLFAVYVELLQNPNVIRLQNVISHIQSQGTDK